MEGTLVVARDRYLDDRIEMRLLPLISIMCLARRCADCRAVDSNGENSFGRAQGRRFSVDELLNTRFPHGISGDVDVDVCKAGKRFEFFFFFFFFPKFSPFRDSDRYWERIATDVHSR